MCGEDQLLHDLSCRLIHMILYFTTQKTIQLSDEQVIDVELETEWFDHLLISSPKNLEKSYEAKSGTHSIKETTISGDDEKRKLISEEDFSKLKKANELIKDASEDFLNLKSSFGPKFIFQVTIAYQLKAMVFQNLFGHSDFFDLGLLAFMRGIWLCKSNQSIKNINTGLANICLYIDSLIPYYNQNPRVQKETFASLEFVLRKYAVEQKTKKKIFYEVEDMIHSTCGKIIDQVIQLHDITYISTKFMTFCFKAEHYQSEETFDRDSALGVYHQALSWIESIRKRKFLKLKTFNEKNTIIIHSICEILINQRRYSECLKYLDKLIIASQVGPEKNLKALVKAYVWIGEINENEGKIQQAIQYYEKSLEIALNSCTKCLCNKYKVLIVLIHLIVCHFRNQTNTKVCYYMKKTMDMIEADYQQFRMVIRKPSLNPRIFIFLNLLPMTCKMIVLSKCSNCGQCRYCKIFTEDSRPKYFKMNKSCWRLLKNSTFINQSITKSLH